jgi:hypothetical protein
MPLSTNCTTVRSKAVLDSVAVSKLDKGSPFRMEISFQFTRGPILNENLKLYKIHFVYLANYVNEETCYEGLVFGLWSD